MNLSYQILTTHWRFGRMWSRYLLHLIQVWPSMLCTSEKLKEVCFQSNHHWTGSKAIRELHEITFIFKEIKYPHYEVNKPNEQHQFDLFYVPHNFFQGNTYKYILTDVKLASRYKTVGALKTNKVSDVAFVLESVNKEVCMFKYPKIFQTDMCSQELENYYFLNIILISTCLGIVTGTFKAF